MRSLTVAVLLAGCGSLRAADVKPLLVDAQSQFQESHYEQALKLYKEAQDKGGADASVAYNIGLCHLHLGDDDKAVEHFERVASEANARPPLRRDAFFNIGVIRATAARQRLEKLLTPAPDAEGPKPPDSPENIEELKAIAGDLLRAIVLFRESENVEPSDDARHNTRAVRITRRNVLGLLKNAIEAKAKKDMLDDPPAYLEALIGQQRAAVSATRYTILNPPPTAGELRHARRSILRLQRQIMERTGTFADHLAQFRESAPDDQTSPGEPVEETPREQAYHAAAERLESSIEAQRDASAFLMDAEADLSFDSQVKALDQMYVALRLFPQDPQQALVKARTEQEQLEKLVGTFESDADWLQDPILGRASIPDDAEWEPTKTALYYDQSQVLSALAILRMQCEQIAAGSDASDTDVAGTDGRETPPQLDPELNRRLADALEGVGELGSVCLEAITATDKDETLSAQQRILDRIDAALDLLPKSIEQRIQQLIVRQSALNEEVKAHAGDVSTEAGEEGGSGLDELGDLAARVKSEVLGGPPSQTADRFRSQQDDIHSETEAVYDEIREQIPTGESDPAGPPPDGQSAQVQAYIEASKHVEQADFEMLVAIEGLDKAIIRDSLNPLKADGPVQTAQTRALEELIKALQALRPPEDQSQCGCDKQEQQDQPQPDEQDREAQDARRAVEREEQQRERAERELYQRRPRTVIKDW